MAGTTMSTVRPSTTDRPSTTHRPSTTYRPSATDGPSATDLTHAGAGLALGIVQLGAIIPGFMAGLILTIGLVAIIVLPLVVLGLVAALLAAPPYALWRLAARRRQRRAELDA